MKYLFGTLFFIALVFAIYNDQANTPAITDDLKSRAESEYYTSHPDATNLPPKPFATDGCTLFPDSFFSFLDWSDICIEHDIAYWGGGNIDLRIASDNKLKIDGNKIMSGLGTVMAFITNITGTPNFPTPWRWGYGWAFGKGYRD